MTVWYRGNDASRALKTRPILVPTVGSGTSYITAGSDGALWFTEFSANRSDA